MNKPQLVKSLELSFRRKRFRLITHLCSRISHRPIRVLDVGGTVAYWADVDFTSLGPVEIVLFNLTAPEVSPPFSAVAGDARDLSRYPKHAFDIVYSNAVINLVGGSEDQARMAEEIRRVGRLYAVQTPNRYFPIDWRTLVPCFHWLPVTFQAWCLCRIAVGLYRRARSKEHALHLASRVRDLTKKELLQMFPEGTIVPERIAGFTKSFIVYGRTDT